MKNHSFLDSLKHAFDGVVSAITTERNLKIDAVIAIWVIVCGVLFDITTIEWFICIGWIAIVIGAELFNTAIEAIVDMTMPDINPLAKKAKDVSAGAVLILALLAAVSGLMIFIPQIICFIENL